MENSFYKKHIRLILTIVFLATVFILAEVTGIRKQFSLESVKTIFNNHFLISAAIYIFLFTVGNILQIPGWLFLAASIITLGQWTGYLLTLVAAVTSAVVGFYIINLIGKDSLRKIKWQWVKKALQKMDQQPIRVNILLRIVFQTAPPLNYALAMSGVKFRDYLIGAIIGLPFPIYIYTFFIDELAQKAF